MSIIDNFLTKLNLLHNAHCLHCPECAEVSLSKTLNPRITYLALWCSMPSNVTSQGEGLWAFVFSFQSMVSLC